jgi:hypothetical protein
MTNERWQVDSTTDFQERKAGYFESWEWRSGSIKPPRINGNEQKALELYTQVMELWFKVYPNFSEDLSPPSLFLETHSDSYYENDKFVIGYEHREFYIHVGIYDADTNAAFKAKFVDNAVV